MSGPKITAVIGENLKKLRNSYCINQILLASFLGVTRGEISYFENNKRTMSIVTLEKICDFFGITIDQITNSNFRITESPVNFRNRNMQNHTTMQAIYNFNKFIRNYSELEKV